MARNTNPLGRTNAKNTEPDTTRVIFRMWTVEHVSDGDTYETPITIYPDQIGTNGMGWEHPSFREAYQSNGGHGNCHLMHIMSNSRPALPHEYARMERELTNGYGLTLRIALPLPKEVPDRVHQKRTDNYGVAEAWRNGVGAQSHNGNLYTDGLTLYSYAMPIGKTLNGVKTGLDAYGMSATTTGHVQSMVGVSRWVQPITISGLWYTAWGALKTKWLEWPSAELE